MSRYLPTDALRADTTSSVVSRVKVYNGTGTEIAEGSLVYASGLQGTTHLKVTLADDDAAVSKAGVLFIADGPIPDADYGECVVWKVLTSVNTNGSTLGNPVYLSAAAGGWTLSDPGSGRRVGSVVAVDATAGAVLLAPGLV